MQEWGEVSKGKSIYVLFQTAKWEMSYVMKNETTPTNMGRGTPHLYYTKNHQKVKNYFWENYHAIKHNLYRQQQNLYRRKGRGGRGRRCGVQCRLLSYGTLLLWLTIPDRGSMRQKRENMRSRKKTHAFSAVMIRPFEPGRPKKTVSGIFKRIPPRQSMLLCAYCGL